MLNIDYKRELEYGLVITVYLDGSVDFQIDGRPYPYLRIPAPPGMCPGDRCVVGFVDRNRQLPFLLGSGRKRKAGGKPTEVSTEVSAAWIQFHQDAKYSRAVPYEISGTTVDNLKVKWTTIIEESV